MCLETVSRSYYESGLHFNIKHFMHYEINVYFKNRDRLKTIFPDSVLYLIYRYLFQYIIIRRNKTNGKTYFTNQSIIVHILNTCHV